eukprot:UN01208
MVDYSKWDNINTSLAILTLKKKKVIFSKIVILNLIVLIYNLKIHDVLSISMVMSEQFKRMMDDLRDEMAKYVNISQLKSEVKKISLTHL